MNTSLEDTLEEIQAEEAQRGDRLAMRQVRKFLAGALCCECGEQLGEDEEIVQDDEERTIHARCEKS